MVNFSALCMNNSSRYHFGTTTQNGLEVSFWWKLGTPTAICKPAQRWHGNSCVGERIKWVCFATEFLEGDTSEKRKYFVFLTSVATTDKTTLGDHFGWWSQNGSGSYCLSKAILLSPAVRKLWTEHRTHPVSKIIILSKVFAELFSKSDRVPRVPRIPLLRPLAISNGWK